MLIDLRNINTFWYGGISEQRVKKITKWLNLLNLKYSHIPGIIHKNGIIGCKQSCKKALSESLKVEEPVLILEDDCAPTDWYNPIFEVPNNADAVYVGTSIRGLTNDWMYKNYKRDNIWVGRPKILDVHKQVYKISNMLTTHAILYITKKYKEYCINLLEYCVIDDLPCDIIFAEGMKKFNVYALRKPLFYQDCDCVNTKIDTLTPIEKL